MNGNGYVSDAGTGSPLVGDVPKICGSSNGRGALYEWQKVGDGRGGKGSECEARA